jgi:tellurite resistance protein
MPPPRAPETVMPLSTQDALIHLMVLAASSDARISERELGAIAGLVVRSPVFDGFDPAELNRVAEEAVDLLKDSSDIDKVLEMVLGAIPARLHDTAYALAVEVTTVDLRLEQEELRLLEMIRDGLELDGLVAAAIEASARARLRGA